METSIAKIEWRTLALIAAVYLGLMLSTTLLMQLSLVLSVLATAVLIALHSSLQHEALHGHPTRNARVNEALVFPAVGLCIPYGRFRDLHLAHHNDELLTDPHNDPESNFLAPEAWESLPAWARFVYRVNNTLAGRMALGPALTVIFLIKGDVAAFRRGEAGIVSAWILHLLGLVPVIWWLSTFAAIPAWAYILASYLGLSLLKIRTYLEHRAFEDSKGRTVIIEDRGPLAFLFLNNNYHIVHHTHPGQPWYRMQQIYYADPEKYRRINGNYVYRNYPEVFQKYFFHAKDPVAHPLLSGVKRQA